MGLREEMVLSNPKVLSNSGRVALRRGPLVYCFEDVDNPEVDVRDIALTPETTFEPKWEETLGGILTLGADVYALDGWGDRLYVPLDEVEVKLRRVKVKAEPYYAWGNRGNGRMVVWVRFSNPPDQGTSRVEKSVC